MEIELIPQSIEEFTRDAIFKDLAKGDLLWDMPHTKAVVHHTKEILKTLPDKVDNTVVIIAAYAHDWGYSEFYKPGQSLTKEEYMIAKKTHAQIAVNKMKELLKNDVYNSLTEQQKERIIHLIQVHDFIDTLKDKDELILMEADSLGGLDTDFITSTWTKEQTIKHLEVVRNKRFPLFVTEYGKQKFEECFNKRLNA